MWQSAWSILWDTLSGSCAKSYTWEQWLCRWAHRSSGRFCILYRLWNSVMKTFRSSKTFPICNSYTWSLCIGKHFLDSNKAALLIRTPKVNRTQRIGSIRLKPRRGLGSCCYCCRNRRKVGKKYRWSGWFGTKKIGACTALWSWG